MEKRLQLFPHSTEIRRFDGVDRLAIGGCDLTQLAEEYGTPLYIYDQSALDAAVDEYRAALAAHYPGPAGITYAGKALINLAAARWAAGRGLWVDCTGAGELYIATRAGVPREQILVHGVNKSPADLWAAVETAGTIVVDNLTELERLAALADSVADFPQLWLRVRPGLAVDTHAFRQTGQDDSKFGMGFAEAVQAVTLCRTQGLPLTGVHFHQGSHFHDPQPIGPALDRVLELLAELRDASSWTPAYLSPGGGWGVPYHEDDLPHPSIDDYVAFLSARLAAGCAANDLPLPILHVEPGRSIVAVAGVALYRVGAVKRTSNRRWLLLDGGMADNIRPSLYGARYSALPVANPLRPALDPAWLGGPYCESGDVLIENLLMADVQPGELLAVPVSGAYHLMMSSNYNGALRPAVVWLQDGQAQLIQRRETVEDLVDRDEGMKG
ncbi:MAG: diaminopimelate decarboxylase [Chloroflexi bacterium]|nr:diaminopimelate decarboxylase [Chloroflexota bacterium]